MTGHLLSALASACLLLPSIAVRAESVSAKGETTAERPNFVVVFTDDQGYGDLGSYGAEGFQTPHLDRMAEEGVRFTDFYVPAPVCTPSRAALLTGVYPKRVGLAYRVLFPFSDTGLNPDEVTIPEVLKPLGYTSALIGKWHLGHHPEFLPTRQGFDYYYGIPYSNDMANVPYGTFEWARRQGADPDFVSPPTPVLRNEETVQEDPDQRYLTRRFTEEALRFMSENRHRPFFLFLAHSMPHVPIAASERFEGSSEHGLYGDVIAEIDWSVGEILRSLREWGLDEKTLVVFTSDNGPQLWEGEGGWVWTPENDGRDTRGEITYRSGSAGPLRGAKNTTWEGGMRVPMIARWPGRIPAGIETNQVATTMDFLPTFAAMTGAPLPRDRILDGKDIRDLLFGRPGAVSPYVAFFYYRDDRLQAVRSGRWKLHVYRPEWGQDNFMSLPRPLLFDLYEDVGETTDLAERHPDVVRWLQALADGARDDLGDAVTGRPGSNVRPVGRLSAVREDTERGPQSDVSPRHAASGRGEP